MNMVYYFPYPAEVTLDSGNQNLYNEHKEYFNLKEDTV